MLGERGIVVQIALRPFAAPPLRMKTGVDDQPRRAPCLIGQHSEQLIGRFVHAHFFAKRFGIELPSLALDRNAWRRNRSEEHTSELQSLMRISYAVFCLKKTKYY